MGPLSGPTGWLVTMPCRSRKSREHSNLRAPVQGSWKLPGSATNSAQRERSQSWGVRLSEELLLGTLAPPPVAAAAAAVRGTDRSSAPGLTAQSLHGKLLRANVAGPMESAGLPSAKILGCVSYAHRHGSFESLVCTCPLHITVFFQQFLYFGAEGGEKV